MGEPMPRQLAAISTAIGVAVDQGVDREQLKAILVQALPETVLAALGRSIKMFAALSTIAATAIRCDCDEMGADVHRRLFLLGWQAAQDDSVGQITANDIGD